MSLQIQLRRGTAAAWTAANTLLAQGEFGFETDTLKFKLGDGSTVWNSLPYYSTSAGVVWGTITGTLSTQTDLQTALNAKYSTPAGTVNQILSGTGSVLSTLPTAAVPAFTGDATNSAGSLALTLTTIGSATGPIGSSSTVPVVTIDAKGRTTALTSATITPAAIGAFGTPGGTVNQILSGTGSVLSTLPTAAEPAHTGDVTNSAGSLALTLASIITAGGPTGSASVVPVITYDAKGRLTAVTTATITPAAIGALATPTGTVNQILSGTGSVLSTLPTAAVPAFTGDAMNSAGSLALTLATVNSNVGSFGAAATVPVVTVSAKGLVTAVTTATITPAAIGALATPTGTVNQILSGTGSVLSTLPTAAVPAFTGDVTNTAGSLTTTIAASAVTLAKMANLAANSILGNNTASPAAPIALTVAQTQALIQLRIGTTSTAQGGTITLTATSTRQQIVTGTGTTNTIIVLPAATTLWLDWATEIDNSSNGTVFVQQNGGTLLQVIPIGGCAFVNCTSIGTGAGTWDSDLLPNAQTPPLAINGLELWGHSYLDQANVGNGSTNLAPNTNTNFGYILAASLGVPLSQVRNHAVTGSQITNPVRAGAVNTGGGFARILSEIYRTKVPGQADKSRNGNAHLICTGLNDIGFTASGSQATMRSTALDVLTVCVAKMRAAIIVNGNSSGLGLAYTGTWAAAAAGAVDYTSGNGWATSTTGGVFTFTLPANYQGEPITFAMVGYSAASALSVTWGGTAGVTGTTTLNSRAFGAQSIVPFRVTTLTAANAGETITGTVTLSGTTFILDGVFIEALKPVPVLICTQPRLPCKSTNVASGAGTTTGATTAFTDASITFNSTTDAGVAMAETDAQGAFTGNVNTISSVTNATTIVLGTAATGAHTSIKYTIARKYNGYPTNGWTNADFTGATIASHSAADTDITTWNSGVIAALKTVFPDPMFQVVDLDAAMGSDANLPTGVYSWFEPVNFAHLGEVGTVYAASICYAATQKMVQNSSVDFLPLGLLQVPAVPTYRSAGKRRLIQNTAIAQGSGAWYLPEGANLDVVANAYTAVAGDLFAFPLEISESAIYAMGAALEQIGATGTSIVRVGIYNDLAGPDGTPSGYPQSLLSDGGLTTLTAANSVQALGNFYRPLYPGLWWLAFGISSLGTASTLRTTFGPSPLLPSWNHTVNGVIRPIAWKVTGQTLSSAMPEIFPSGGALVGCAGGTFASASAAPLVALELHVF